MLQKAFWTGLCTNCSSGVRCNSWPLACKSFVCSDHQHSILCHKNSRSGTHASEKQLVKKSEKVCFGWQCARFILFKKGKIQSHFFLAEMTPRLFPFFCHMKNSLDLLILVVFVVVCVVYSEMRIHYLRITSWRAKRRLRYIYSQMQFKARSEI